MLVKPDHYLRKALKSDYALGAFNTSNLELTQAIIAGAEAQQSPVIVETSEGAIKYAGLETLRGIVSILADQTDVPVALHLDHGHSLEVVKQCIEVGYTSVMIDASQAPLQENIAKVSQVVAYAHERGIWVEAELGAIMGAEGMAASGGKGTPEDFLTKPEEAENFIRATKADALAVSVGTIHGAFSGVEYIRFSLLEELGRKMPEVPLVLHGASGVADKQLRRAARMNIIKVNIDTEMRIAFTRAVKAYFDERHDDYDPREILGPAREAVQMVVEEKIKLLGTAGRAGV